MCCQVQTNFVLYKIPSPEASSRVQLPSSQARIHFSLGTGALKYKISAQIRHELFKNTSPVQVLVPAVARLNDIRGRPDTRRNDAASTGHEQHKCTRCNLPWTSLYREARTELAKKNS